MLKGWFAKVMVCHISSRVRTQAATTFVYDFRSRELRPQFRLPSCTPLLKSEAFPKIRPCVDWRVKETYRVTSEQWHMQASDNASERVHFSTSSCTAVRAQHRINIDVNCSFHTMT